MIKNKKGKRLKDVLDEKYTPWPSKKFLKTLTYKFVKLHSRIVSNSNIPKHNNDLKWCGKVIDKLGDGVTPSKSDLETANILWKQYK